MAYGILAPWTKDGTYTLGSEKHDIFNFHNDRPPGNSLRYVLGCLFVGLADRLQPEACGISVLQPGAALASAVEAWS